MLLERRGTVLPARAPIALSEEFSGDEARQALWQAFVRRSGLIADIPALPNLLVFLRSFLLPVVDSLQEGAALGATWLPGGPWSMDTAPPIHSSRDL